MTVLPATIEDINTVRIWPANNSLLFVSHEVDFVIQAKLDSLMRKVSVMFDGSDITHLLGKYAQSEYATTGSSYWLRISIPAFTVPSGVHTVYVEITTASGLVISDTAVYTAIETFPAPSAPPFLEWPCIFSGTPCE